ncbi:MAG: hypothetical protein H0T89_36625 [Deltaproteobacteria bacterium]|nr:hypothetical protein [Deltaproteobacteria bacterium]MDQ3298287.1 hypothetical protein [Myxococcota bacterium]
MSDPHRALRPTSGARLLLERTATAGDDAARATYRTAIYTPDAEFTGTATLVDDGTVDVAPTGAPAELDDMLTMLAKLTARGAAKRREDGLPAWPGRLLRWRGPRGAGRG